MNELSFKLTSILLHNQDVSRRFDPVPSPEPSSLPVGVSPSGNVSFLRPSCLRGLGSLNVCPFNSYPSLHHQWPAYTFIFKPRKAMSNLKFGWNIIKIRHPQIRMELHPPVVRNLIK